MNNRDIELPESSLVHHIGHTIYGASGKTLAQPDGHWDIVVFKQQGRYTVVRTGLTTRAVTVEYQPGDEILTISFKPNAFMPLMPGQRMRDEGVVLPKIGKHHFWIGTDVFEIPTFDTADIFIEKLLRSGLIFSSDVVTSILEGRPKAMSERTMQRHFLKTTGLTYKFFTQVQRAQQALAMLKAGQSPVKVAHEAGFTDQAHMTKSLKTLLSLTPGQISRAKN